MDLLDRLLGHDAWTTRELLTVCEPLSDEQLDRRFEIGHGSLRETFRHMIWNMEVWTDLMCERPVRKPAGREGQTIPALLARLDAVAPEFAAVARRIQDTNRLDDYFPDTLCPVPPMLPFGGGIVHLCTHGMHHRAQILNILRHLGIKHDIEGDALSWEASQRLGGWATQADHERWKRESEGKA